MNTALRFIIGASLIAAAFVPACKSCPPPEHITVLVGDAGPYVEPFDTPDGAGYRNAPCAKACANLQDKSCPDGFKRPGEDSCYVVCRNAEETGKIDFHVDCIAAAKDRAAIAACHSYRCQ